MDQQIRVPDIGGVADVEIVEILVKPGERIEKEQSLITLESDKAAMEVPAPLAGTVTKLNVSIGDRVSEGASILLLDVDDSESKDQPIQAESQEEQEPQNDQPAVVPESPSVSISQDVSETSPSVPMNNVGVDDFLVIHASPSVRRFARELGADLSGVNGTGRKGRILRDDVKSYIKTSLQQPNTSLPGFTGTPEIDFSSFGDIEPRVLSKIQRISGDHLHKSWVSIPHVTQHGESDISQLEDFRRQLKKELVPRAINITLLPFLMKSVVATLQKFPTFNASLNRAGTELIIKKYFHIGVAVDTPDGLLVPVIRDVERKGLVDLAVELADVSSRARQKKLKPAEMQGGSFTISSLGGIGGTAFTPIINHPEVAILGVSRSEKRPVWVDNVIEPRLILPLSLSYDHRVIDGAAAARFVVDLGRVLSDLRRILV